MSSLEEKLSRLNNQYQYEVRKCNIKYDKLVREYRIHHPSKKIGSPFANVLTVAGCSYVFTLGISCFTNCDDWWNGGDDFYFYLLHIILPTLVITGIYFLISMCKNLICKNINKFIENPVNALECERKQELDKLQKEYDVDRLQIIAKYNQNRDMYLKQLRNSNNTMRLVQQIFSDFERAYGMIDKSKYIKNIIFDFGISVNRECISIRAVQGKNILHGIDYPYQRMQMKNLENIEICEALAVVISEEVNFMIKNHYERSVTDVVIRDGVLVLMGFNEPNINYKGLESW